MGAALLVTAVLGACGGGGSSSTAPTGFTGTASGTVTDSSGNAISNAVVSYTGTPAVSTTTNSAGQFALSGIQVSAISVGNGSPISFQVVPPTGAVKYMTATVNAIPKAQLSPGATPSVSSTFSLNLGTIQIPAMAIAVTGTLRDSSTGAAISGVQLAMAFVATNFTKTTAPTGVTIALNPSSISPVTTAADGSFAFRQVYNDSCVRMNMLNYAISDGSAPTCAGLQTSSDGNSLQLSTVTAVKSEDQINGVLQLSTVSAQAFSSGDTIPPVVTQVDNALDSGSSPSPLASSVTGVCQTLSDGTVSGGLIVDFSEPMLSGVTTSNVKIVSGSLSAPVTQPLQSVQFINNNTQLQICTAAALPVPSNIFVEIMREVLKDQSSNQNGIALNQSIAYDSFATINGVPVLLLTLATTSTF